MNILILLPDDAKENALILKHAKLWSHAGHKLTVFTLSREKKEAQIKDSINFIYHKTSPLTFRLTAPLWNMVGDHERFDLVVEYWKGLPFFSPLYSKARKLIWVHKNFKLENYKNLKLDKLYKNTDYVVTDSKTQLNLVKLGVNSFNIKYLPRPTDPKPLLKPIKSSLSVTALIDETQVVDRYVSLFNMMDRRDDTWKFYLLTKTPEVLQDIKTKIAGSDFAGRTNIKKYSKRNLMEFVSKAKFFVILHPLKGVRSLSLTLSRFNTPPASFKFKEIDQYINKDNALLANANEVSELAKLILETSKTDKMYAKLQDNIIKYGKRFTWEEIGRESLKYIDSL